jgi:hypothetical protein
MPKYLDPIDLLNLRQCNSIYYKKYTISYISTLIHTLLTKFLEKHGCVMGSRCTVYGTVILNIIYGTNHDCDLFISTTSKYANHILFRKGQKPRFSIISFFPKYYEINKSVFTSQEFIMHNLPSILSKKSYYSLYKPTHDIAHISALSKWNIKLIPRLAPKYYIEFIIYYSSHYRYVRKGSRGRGVHQKLLEYLFDCTAVLSEYYGFLTLACPYKISGFFRSAEKLSAVRNNFLIKDVFTYYSHHAEILRFVKSKR